MKITNRFNLPQPLVDLATRDYEYTPGRYSVTALFSPPRQVMLMRRHDHEITVDVSEMLWALIGQAFHAIAENAQETATQLKENKIHWEIEGRTLSGIFDLYDDATGTITDYKTGSVWKAMFDDWADMRDQVLAYGWIMRKYGFDVKRGEIVFLMKDHQKSKAMFDREYPDLPIMKETFTYSPKNFEEIEVVLRARMRDIIAVEDVPDADLPVCSDKDRWYSGTKYAVKKKNRKNAVRGGVCDSLAAAEKMVEQGKGDFVETRPGINKRCAMYCYAKDFCDFYQREVKNGPAENGTTEIGKANGNDNG